MVDLSFNIRYENEHFTLAITFNANHVQRYQYLGLNPYNNNIFGCSECNLHVVSHIHAFITYEKLNGIKLILFGKE